MEFASPLLDSKACLDLSYANPKHPKAPAAQAAQRKYGEEHYPEETVSDEYTLKDDLGRRCRYILSFLVYNAKGERLQKLSQISHFSVKGQPLSLYGQLLPTRVLIEGNGEKVLQVKNMLKAKRKRNYESMGILAPYPVVAKLDELVLEYGATPDSCPAMWLRSIQDVYYRLEEPAGRYMKSFSEEKRRFDVCTRLLKTLQWKPYSTLDEIVNLIAYGHRVPNEELVRLLSAAAAAAPVRCKSDDDGSGVHCKLEDLSDCGADSGEAPTAERDSNRFAIESLRNIPGEEATPWGEKYRVFPPITPVQIIRDFGFFIKEQARVFGLTYFANSASNTAFMELPAMQQLNIDLQRQVTQQPGSQIGTGGNTPQGMMTPSTQASPANNIISYGSQTSSGYDQTQSMHTYPVVSGCYGFPRMWMRTALHVFDSKPLHSYWDLTPEEQRRKPYFLGYDWLWSPHVVTGQQIPDDPEIPIPTCTPIILPDPPEICTPPPRSQSNLPPTSHQFV